MDPLDRIDEIIAHGGGGTLRPDVPQQCMVDRAELIAALEELRAELPVELRRAAALLEERDKIIEAGKREADRIISEGEAEHARLVSVNEITVSAEHEGARIIARGPGRGAAAARGGRRLRRHGAGQLRAVPDPGAGLHRARPGQDARPAGDRLVRGGRGRAPAAVLIRSVRLAAEPTRRSGAPGRRPGSTLRAAARVTFFVGLAQAGV